MSLKSELCPSLLRHSCDRMCLGTGELLGVATIIITLLPSLASVPLLLSISYTLLHYLLLTLGALGGGKMCPDISLTTWVSPPFMTPPSSLQLIFFSPKFVLTGGYKRFLRHIFTIYILYHLIFLIFFCVCVYVSFPIHNGIWEVSSSLFVLLTLPLVIWHPQVSTLLYSQSHSSWQHGGHAIHECLKPDDRGKNYKDHANFSVLDQDMLHPCLCEKLQNCFPSVFGQNIGLHFMCSAVEYIHDKNDVCVHETRRFWPIYFWGLNFSLTITLALRFFFSKVCLRR